VKLCTPVVVAAGAGAGADTAGIGPGTVMGTGGGPRRPLQSSGPVYGGGACGCGCVGGEECAWEPTSIRLSWFGSIFTGISVASMIASVSESVRRRFIFLRLCSSIHCVSLGYRFHSLILSFTLGSLSYSPSFSRASSNHPLVTA
jgi:hypothetical protein